MKKRIVVTNDFHNTSAFFLGTPGKTSHLSKKQADRVWGQLCGIKGCTCGGQLGERGSQDQIGEVVDYWDGYVEVEVKAG